MNKWLVSSKERFTPVLQQTALDLLQNYGAVVRFTKGELLVKEGHPYERFIAVLEGTVVVEQQTASGTWPIKTLSKGEFIGEINTLSGRPSRVTARAANDGAIVSLNRPALKKLMEDDRNLGEVIMGAFVLRHLYLIARGAGDVALVGSKTSADTDRLRTLLSQHAYPYLFLDLETEPEIEATLQTFGISREDIPVLIHRHLVVLRKPSVEAVASLLEFATS